MQVGPDLFRQFMAAIGEDNAELMPYIYDALNRLPLSQYNEAMRNLIAGTPEGKNYIRQLAQKIRQKYDVQQQGEELGETLLGS